MGNYRYINESDLSVILERISGESLYNESELTDFVSHRLDKMLERIKRYSKEISSKTNDALKNAQQINLIVGPSGAGKTTIARSMLASPMFQMANSFSQIECFPTIFMKDGAPNNTFIIESILCSQDQRERLINLSKSGMYIRMFFVSTATPFINIDRIVKRDALNNSKSDVRKVLDRYFKSLASAIALTPCVDELVVLDNSIDNQAPRVILQLYGNEVVYQTPSIPKWASMFLGYENQL